MGEKRKKRKKPKPQNKNVFSCKRRKPQPVFEIPSVYNDPHKKEILRFSTASNDGFLNGGCPFSILTNLNNVDDTLIIPEWLAKLPKVSWVLDDEGKVQV